MSELGRNIRTIANTEELQRQINDLQSRLSGDLDKLGIDGSRSIAYKGAKGGIGQASGGTDMQQIQSDIGSSLDDFAAGVEDIFSDESQNQDGTGKDGDASNLEGFTEDLENYKDTTPQLGETFKKLSGLGECGGTAQAEVMLNGLFSPPAYGDGSNFEGYNADQDPRQDQFVAGTYYSQGAGNASDPWTAMQMYVDELNATIDPGQNYVIDYFEAYDPGTDSQVQFHGTRLAGPWTASVAIHVGGCVIGVDAWCPAEAELGDWPVDGIQQLSFDGAQFKTSQFEPKDDVYNPWADDTSNIDACTSSGESVNLKPTGDGGVKVTYGTGQSFSMDANGTVIETSNAVL